MITNWADRLKQTILWLIPFAGLFAISKLFLQSIYFFEWSARHYYLYLWVLVIILGLMGRSVLAGSLSLGNLFGVILAQFLGDVIKQRNIAMVTPNMLPGQTELLQRHPAFYIWLLVVLLSFITGLVVTRLQSKELMAGTEALAGLILGAILGSLTANLFHVSIITAAVPGAIIGGLIGLFVMVYRLRRKKERAMSEGSVE